MMRSRNGGAGAGQKARAHAVGDGAEAQVEARRLDLIGSERIVRANAAGLRQRRDHAVGQNALVGRCEGQRHLVIAGNMFVGDLTRCPV